MMVRGVENKGWYEIITRKRVKELWHPLLLQDKISGLSNAVNYELAN